MTTAAFNDHDRDKWDAIVIGSGLGGLSAAAYLAANGIQTLVLEQHEIVGGCSQVFRRKGRFEWDVGLHYVGDCGPDGVIPTVLRGVGVEDRVEWEPMDPDGFDVFRFPDFEFRVPRGWEAFTDRLAATFPDNAAEIRSCLGELEEIGRLAYAGYAPSVSHPSNYAATNLNLLCAGISAFLRHPRSVLRLLRSARETPSNFFARHRLADEPARLLGMYAGLTGNGPRSCPAVVLAVILEQMHKSGGWYPRGGSQVIAANLADVIKANGGAIRTKARVERVLVGVGRVEGVRLEGGETFSAPVVVSNADPKRTFEDLIDPRHVSRQARRRASKWEFVGQLVTLYLAVDIDIRERLGKTNVWIVPDSLDALIEQADAQSAIAPGRDPVELVPELDDMFLWITCAAAKDPSRPIPRLAEHGAHTTLEVMTWVGPEHRFWGVNEGPVDGEDYHENEDYVRVKQAFTERMTAGAIAAIPELEGRIIWQELATPITQQRYTFATDGSWGGIGLSHSQLPIRPRQNTDIKGLYLSGSSSLYGPGIISAMRCGVATASAVLKRDLWHQVVSGRVFGDPPRLPEHPVGWDPYFASKRMAKKPGRGRRDPVTSA